MFVHPIDVSIDGIDGSVFVIISDSEVLIGAQEVLYLLTDDIFRGQC